jgi:hypothetical protein
LQMQTLQQLVKNRGGKQQAACSSKGPEGPQWQAHRRQALCKSDSGHRWPQLSREQPEQPQPSRKQPQRVQGSRRSSHSFQGSSDKDDKEDEINKVKPPCSYERRARPWEWLPCDWTRPETEETTSKTRHRPARWRSSKRVLRCPHRRVFLTVGV